MGTDRKLSYGKLKLLSIWSLDIHSSCQSNVQLEKKGISKEVKEEEVHFQDKRKDLPRGV